MQLFNEMFRDADENFIEWAIKMVLGWKRESYDGTNLVHIHGTKDLVFPMRFVKNSDYIIKGGSHDIVMSSPKEISRIIEKEIGSS